MNDHLNNSFLNVSEIFKYSNYLHVLIIGQGGIFGMGNTYEEDEEGEEENSIKSEDSTPFGLSSLVKTGTFSGVNSLSNYTSNLDEQKEKEEFDTEYTKAKQYNKKLMPSDDTINALLEEINS